VLPFLPLWLKYKGLEAGEIGVVIAAMTAVRVVAAPLGAFIADRHGNRRQVIAVSALVSFAGYVVMANVEGLWTILAAALMASAFFAPVAPLAEGLAVEGSAAHGLVYGHIRLWASLGFLMGSLISGALLETVPIGSVIHLIAGAQGLLAVAAALLLPADPVEQRQPESRLRAGDALTLAATASFALFIAAVGLGQASHGLLYGFGSVHWDQLGYGKLAIGTLWAMCVMAEVVLFAFSDRPVARFGAATLIAAGIAGGLCAGRSWASIRRAGCCFRCRRCMPPPSHSPIWAPCHFIQDSVPAGLRNTAQGIYAAVSGGIVMSSVVWLSGPLYGAYGGAAYFFMAGISAVALMLALRLRRLSPTEPAAAAP
jgi:PPP family 3-phenylpropionic acid transporter